MNIEWPLWILNSASLSSILALLVTAFLFIEARKIRKSFLRRARLPTITKELAETTSDISNCLRGWAESEKPALKKFANAKGLLENLVPKLPTEEQKQISAFLYKLQPRKYLIMKSSLSDLTEDSAWDLYTDLNTVVTRLEQLVEDSKWD